MLQRKAIGGHHRLDVVLELLVGVDHWREVVHDVGDPLCMPMELIHLPVVLHLTVACEGKRPRSRWVMQRKDTGDSLFVLTGVYQSQNCSALQKCPEKRTFVVDLSLSHHLEELDDL